MSEICLSSAYLAPVEYYTALANADSVLLEQYDYYLKQTYRNRCNIATANGVLTLSIPVEKGNSAKTLMRDIRISAHNDWQSLHWRSIESAYNSSAFFEYYKDDLIPIFEKKWDFLIDFNTELQTKVLELLEVEKIIEFTDKYTIDLGANILDLRESIHPKKENLLQAKKSYYQVFEQRFGFLPNLSIIDLLFNMGNESQLIIFDKQTV